ncbi:MAG: DUF3127 domain-containing protein [Chitinophagales bacterium]
MSLTIDGKIHEIFDAQQVTASFQKREFVLEIDSGSNYPQYPKFQLIQDNCSILDAYSKEMEVTVHFDLKGRPYNKPGNPTIYFTNLQVWRIEAKQTEAPNAQAPTQETGGSMPTYEEDIIENDELPF